MRDLPGPRSFIQRVARDIDEGYSVVVVFPTCVIEAGLGDSILDEIAATCGAVTVAQGRHVPDRVVDSLGYGHAWRPSHDPLWDLAHWSALAGLSAAIRSWEHDLTRVLTRWGPLLHEAGRSPEQRFRLLLGADASAVEAAGLDRAPQMFVRLHWWWGVLDRIDTDLHIRAASPDGVGPNTSLHLGELVEAIAWDFDLLNLLPSASADIQSRLVLALERSGREIPEGGLPEAVRQHQRPSLEGRQTPSAALRPHWDRGNVELWDGRLRPRLLPISLQGELHTLMWRAQVRVLFPYVEEHRADIASIFETHARRAGQTAVDETWELGDMYAAVRQGRVGLPLSTWVLLKAARAVRNDLAHGRLATPRHLSSLVDAKPL